MVEATKNELRCFCSRSPLLAIYGIRDSKLYVHIKIYKQRRIYGEALITEGTVKLHCRECLRWHTVILRPPGFAILEEDSVSPSLPIEA